MASLFLVGCPSKDFPPPFEIICTLDGYGGGACTKKDTTRSKMLPSEMKNYWCTTQEDIAKFSAWAYGIDPSEVEHKLLELRAAMQKPAAGPVVIPAPQSPALKAPLEDQPEEGVPLPHPQNGEPYDPQKNA